MASTLGTTARNEDPSLSSPELPPCPVACSPPPPPPLPPTRFWHKNWQWHRQCPQAHSHSHSPSPPPPPPPPPLPPTGFCCTNWRQLRDSPTTRWTPAPKSPAQLPPAPPPVPGPLRHLYRPYSGNKRRPLKYLKLYKLVIKGDLNKAKEFFQADAEAITAGITKSSETALHVAIRSGHTDFVEELVWKMSAKDLEIKEMNNGDTALHTAAIAGNIQAARVMVEKNPNLPQIRNKNGWIPLSSAAYCSSYKQKEMMEYLLSVTKHNNRSPFYGRAGGELICTITRAGRHGIAKKLIEEYPNLATDKDKHGICALEVLAEMSYAFQSGSQLTTWQRFIYPYIDVDLHVSPISREGTDLPTTRGRKSIMNKFHTVTYFTEVIQSTKDLLWQCAKQLVPGSNKVYKKKLMHKQALDLVKCICEQISEVSYSEISEILTSTNILSKAITSGTVEVVAECIQTFPDLVWFKMNKRNLFEIAIEERHERIFNLVCEMDEVKKTFVYLRDETSGNTILHLAAKLAPPAQLNSVSCVALQMQRELQWYKEVEKISLPINKVIRNKDGKIPQALFREQHKELMRKGGDWMKGTAESCMLVATLIATVVFAAAFTVPGGNYDSGSNNKGIPIFLHEASFMVFAVTDSLALFSSITSVLMFLSILTSRFREEDFLESLPRRLMIGLATLFFSIITMMVAFSATLAIAIGPKFGWFPIPLALMACVPITLFAFLHFHLFSEIAWSTYRPALFRRHKMLY
ncbi:hypothetical protein MKX03_019792 [Papaver bracteatum]|nr:hypothetical protein MKX03_019792 [Papaver bracteatum]